MTHSAPGSRKHALLLAYYFPPMGLSGVQRVSKFAKYLPEYGWDVTVVTARPAGYFAYDETLLTDLATSNISVVRTRSVDPTRLFRSGSTVQLPAEARRKLFSTITHALFVPDNKVGWYPFARRAAVEAHRVRPFDAVLSSAPPYTSLVVARAVARRLDLPLVVDFRDDWVGNPRHEYPSVLHRRLHERLEYRVLESAAACITINTFIADSLRRRALDRGHQPRVVVIPQGFDPSDFPDSSRHDRSDRTQMRFLYSGVFYDAQTPETFLSGLRLVLDRRPDIADSIMAQFAGLVPADFGSMVEARGLEDVVRHYGYETHATVVERIRAADVLWVTIGRRVGSEGISTGKLYEYFGARKPILGLVPAGVARADLVSYGAAEVAEPDDPAHVAAAIERMYDRWSKGAASLPPEDFVRQFDRRLLAGQLARILDAAVVPGGQR